MKKRKLRVRVQRTRKIRKRTMMKKKVEMIKCMNATFVWILPKMRLSVCVDICFGK